MSLKKQIKSFLTLFVVLLLTFTVTAVLLFRKNFEHFHIYISDRSQSHLSLLKNLSRIETNLYIYQQSFQCILESHDDKCVMTLNESRQNVRDNDAALETFNKEEFKPWVVVTEFQAQDSQAELRDTLATYKEAAKNHLRNDVEFQRLYYLVRDNMNRYFDSTHERVQAILAEPALVTTDPSHVATNTSEQNQLELIYLGMNEIREYYNDIFWADAKKQNLVFVNNTENYYLAMLAVSGGLAVFAIVISLLISHHFKRQAQRDENLIVLGTRDMATGLFNKRSLEALLGQEIQRAKRRHYTLSILMIRVEPYEEIKNGLGALALDRLFFQISESLKTSCRSYDTLYKYDKNTFLIVFPEADPKIINSLVARFQKKFIKKRFLVKSDQTKVAPQILIGAAGYPLNGTQYSELVTCAESTLSENFDAHLLQENDGVVRVPALMMKNADVTHVDSDDGHDVMIFSPTSEESESSSLQNDQNDRQDDGQSDDNHSESVEGIPDVVAALEQNEPQAVVTLQNTTEASQEVLASVPSSVSVAAGDAENVDVVIADIDVTQIEDIAERFRQRRNHQKS